MTSRPERRTDYKHFPTAYSDLLIEFSRTGAYRLGPLAKTDALNTRRDLYRYFGFLRASYTTDELAKHLSDIARDLVLKVENPAISGFESTAYYIVLVVNPVVVAMRKASETELAGDNLDPAAE